jgi:hypothetical protein
MDEQQHLPWRSERAEWGLTPPYGAYRGHYGDYALAQYGSLGSGRMGGWSCLELGGSFECTKELDPDRTR